MEAMAQELQTRDEPLKQLKFHLARAQELMTKYANRKRKPVTTKIDDRLPCQQGCIPNYPQEPFKVIQHVGSVAFKLLLPEIAPCIPCVSIEVNSGHEASREGNSSRLASGGTNILATQNFRSKAATVRRGDNIASLSRVGGGRGRDQPGKIW